PVSSFSSTSTSSPSLYTLSLHDALPISSFNGFFFAETLKSEKKYAYKNQPIIAVTGRKDLDKESYIEAGFAGFLFKPCHPDELLDRKSTRLNSSHVSISYAVFCLKKNTE